MTAKVLQFLCPRCNEPRRGKYPFYPELCFRCGMREFNRAVRERSAQLKE